jgi:Ca2+-transporting ATPase
MRTIAQVHHDFPTTPEQGLTPEQVQKSLKQFRSNKLTPLPREPAWKKFVEKFDEPIIKILLVAALLSMIVGLFHARPVLGGIGLGLVVVAVAAAFATRQQRWVPTIMFVSAIVLFFLGLVTGHTLSLVEGLAVMVAVILATGVAFLNEYKSDREFEVLNARREAIHVKVVRGGEFHTLPLEAVVVGDIVELEMGDEIPADGRLLKATELYIDQSLMTGEAEPVRKQPRPADDSADGPEQPGCLYRGTQVVDGVGVMCVTEVGDATYLGQIARRLSAEEDEEEGDEAAAEETSSEKRIKRKLTISKELTPLQQKLTQLAELISRVGYVAAGLIFVAELIRGVSTGELYFPTEVGQIVPVLRFLLEAFVLMVIIIVVAVPEGLPMSVTVSLALAMQKMTRANSLVRQLVACETIGSATVICSDKTGTLTQNKMRVDRLSWDGHIFDRDTPAWVKPESHLPWPRDGKPLDWMLINAAVNSTANLEEKEGKIQTVGNSTEGALLQYLRENGMDYIKLRLQFGPLYQIHFSSERKRMTSVIAYGERLVALVKGAPEWVLEHSVAYQTADGTTLPWTPEAKQAVQAGLQDSAIKAMRTLAFGYKIMPPDVPHDGEKLQERREELESDLVFAGFVAIRDPLREDVKDAVACCRSAGIEVKMITGDNVQTARAIGYNIGLIDQAEAPINTEEAVVLTSDKFNELTDEQLKQRLPRLRILARARPLDKFRMVKLLQELGEVVAVTGDGTNDAPALKKADVGLAMGIAGTEVAKEASKIVLLDDSFATIVKAVQWGRSLYENIQRFIQFQLTINVSALTIAFLGPLFFGVKAPFTVLQLLWINVIMDTFAAIALCSEPPRPGVMEAPPKKRNENILTPAMIRTILITAGFFVVVMLATLVVMRGNPFAPGFFADSNPETWWSFESSGLREAVPAKYLKPTDPTNPAEGKWQVKDVPADESLFVLNGIEGYATFTIFQVSIFFSIYVFFQVWNQINCRSLSPRESGFHRIWENPTFLMIAGAVALGQILIVTIGGAIFKVAPLPIQYWIGIIVFTSTVLVFAEIARRVQMLILARKATAPQANVSGGAHAASRTL